MLPDPCQPHNKGLEATLTFFALKAAIVIATFAAHFRDKVLKMDG